MNEQETFRAAGLDWIDWKFFLVMLSVRRTEGYADELALPGGQGLFPGLMRLARACLEVAMYPSTLTPEAHADSPGFAEAWQAYRAAGGVLSDAELETFFARLGRSTDAARVASRELAERFAGDVAEGLERWFVENFRPRPDPAWQWPWALERLLAKGRGPGIEPPPPGEAEAALVSRFCKDYRAASTALQVRFIVTRKKALLVPPTLWERVLQTFPADGPLADYPGLSEIESCLSFRLLRRKWDELRAALGADAMRRLTAWARSQEKLLPYDTTLPAEPAPL